MNIQELADMVAETPRQIRYLIAEGIIPPPGGSRTRPDYGPAHVAAVHRYRALRDQGLKPSGIRALLLAESLARDGGQFALAPGVTLTIDPALLPPDIRPHDIGDLARAALEHILNQLAEGGPDAV
ncbi:MAG TPA: helix-turn-helix domain-containing protein [Roseomonas sp.]